MKRAVWTDDEGRKWATWIPSEADDSEAPFGVPHGPPDLSDLNLPEHILIRLHNELFARGILTADEALKAPGEVMSALQASFRIDTQRVQDVYLNQLKQTNDSRDSGEEPINDDFQ